jgi:hypothetical protein
VPAGQWAGAEAPRDGLPTDQNTLFITGRQWKLDTCRVGPTEFANPSRAAARGDFSSLETAPTSAEQRRATLQAELARLDGNQQPTVIQLTPAALQRHLQGMTEKLRSGVNREAREAIQQSITQILVGLNGSLRIEAKPGGLLGVNGDIAQLDSREGWAPIEPRTLSAGGRALELITAGEASRPAARRGLPPSIPGPPVAFRLLA